MRPPEKLRLSATSGLLVVHGVEAVVENEEIHPSRHEVARTVPARPRVAVDVLKVVREHEAPEGGRRRNAQGRRVDPRASNLAVEPDGKGPGRGVHAEDDEVLGDVGGVRALAASPCALEEASRQWSLSHGGDEEEGHRREETVLGREPPGDRRVAPAIDELVMILVVGRDPHECRIAIEDRYPRREEIVGPAPDERGRVVVIVRDHAGAVSEVHRGGQQPPVKVGPHILRDHGGGHEHERPGERPRVRSMSKSHGLFPCRARTIGY